MPSRHFNQNTGRHNPFQGYLKDNFFDDQIGGDFNPSTNVLTHDDRYEIHMAVPGYKREYINISVAHNTLTIEAEEVETSEMTGKFNRREFYQVGFSRSFDLPEDVNEDEIKARMEDGVLKVSIGRHDHDPKQRSRQIDIS